MQSHESPDEHADSIRAFWDWFRGRVAVGLDPDDPRIVPEFERHLAAIHPDLSWEIGPGSRARNALAISPSGDLALRPLADSVVSSAPSIRNWEVHSGRQRREWSPEFRIELKSGGVVAVDATDWKFALLRYPDGVHELVILASHSGLEGDALHSAVSFVVESALGEYDAMGLLDSLTIDVEEDPRLQGKLRPISELGDLLRRR